MSRNNLRSKRGSKKDWPHVTGQIPPEAANHFDALVTERQTSQTELVREAVEAFLASYGYTGVVQS